MIKYNIKKLDTTGNQQLIELENKIMFISYKTIVFTYNTDTKILEFDSNEYTYTKTTCKYLTYALGLLNCYTKYKSEYLNKLCYGCNNRKQTILNNNIIKLEV